MLEHNYFDREWKIQTLFLGSSFNLFYVEKWNEKEKKFQINKKAFRGGLLVKHNLSQNYFHKFSLFANVSELCSPLPFLSGSEKKSQKPSRRFKLHVMSI